MKQKVLLCYVLVGILSVSGRIGYVIHDQSFRQPPYTEVERAAISLADEGSIGRIYSEKTGKSAHVSPLYPMFLAALYRVFGPQTLAGRLAQEFCAILATTTGFLLLPLVASRTRLPASAGWIAALVLAVLPANLWLETSGTWEQPYSALALLLLLVLFCKVSDSGWRCRRAILLTGLLVGIISLLSPSLLPAGVLMVLAELFAQRGNRLRVVKGSLAMALMAALLLTPWVVRNYIVLGGFVPLRSNFGLELAIGNNASSNGQTYTTSHDDPGSPFRKIHPFTSAEQRDHLLAVGELSFMREKQQIALKWMADNPGRTVELTARRCWLYWFPSKDLWSKDASSSDLKASLFRMISIAAFADLVLLLLARSARVWLLAAAMVGPSLVYMVTHVEPRYRYPIFGISTLLSTHFVLFVGTFLGRAVFARNTDGKPDGIVQRVT